MSEDVEPYVREVGMWESGWLLGKYEKRGRLPASEEEAAEWYQGFVIGTVEAILYDKLTSRLEMLVGDSEALVLIDAHRQAAKRSGL